MPSRGLPCRRRDESRPKSHEALFRLLTYNSANCTKGSVSLTTRITSAPSYFTLAFLDGPTNVPRNSPARMELGISRTFRRDLPPSSVNPFHTI
ncbi:hypothetical protein PsYK624_123140 [Phanerochaete sordida]|uniref:Uncharacterized protein n=1 Tax=Phanerochaete sordida TaxID=48140 RepID=A0A9P3GJW1_9APHY|nr:hypothetical protein PsYK624_123140 [Phanerochaete sordida]